MIPYFLEKLIHEGKAEHKTFTGGLSNEFIIPVPDKTYIVIYEYYFRPQYQNMGTSTPEVPIIDWQDAIQFVNFYNKDGFYPYWHSVNLHYVNQPLTNTVNPNRLEPYIVPDELQTDYRQTYIKTSSDLAVYFSRLNANDLVWGQQTIPNIEPINNVFGYGNQLTDTAAQFYNTNGAQAYTPFQQQGTKFTVPVNQGFAQLYTIPSAGGAIQNGSGITGAEFSLGKARLIHFQCNYVQVNMENPKNLI
jgi:hypothetical protein